MSLFTREQNMDNVEGLVVQNYVPQHPVMSMPKITSKSKSDHLDMYQEVQPFEGRVKMPKFERQCETKMPEFERQGGTKMTDFESSEGIKTWVAEKVGLIKSTRLVEKDEPTAFKKALEEFYESKQTNLHVHPDRTFRCDARGKNCEEGFGYYWGNNADYSARHDAEPYQDGRGFAHVRPEHDFALFVTNESYMGTGDNDYNVTTKQTIENGIMRPRRTVTTMLDGRELKYEPDLSLPGTAIYIAEGNDLVTLRTLVIGFRGSRLDRYDGSANWDWLLTDAAIGLGIDIKETPRFKYSLQHILRLLLDSDRFDQVIFTGHSLGGTLANTMYHQLRTILPECSGSIIFNAGVGLEVDGGGNIYNTASYRMVNDPVSGRVIKMRKDSLTGRLDGIVTRNSVSFDGAKNGWVSHVMGNFLPSNVINRNDGSIVSGNDTVRERVKLLSIMRSLWMHTDENSNKIGEEWSVSRLRDSLADFGRKNTVASYTKIYIDRFQPESQLKAEICVLVHVGTGNEKICYSKFDASKKGQHDVQNSRFFQKGKVTQKLISKSKQDELDEKNGGRESYFGKFEDDDKEFDDSVWKSISTLRFKDYKEALHWASGAGEIMSNVNDILAIKYIAENPNPKDIAASEEFLKQKQELKTTGKSKWKRAVRFTKLKLQENNTEEDINLLEIIQKAQDTTQMEESKGRIAKAREKFAKFNQKRFFTIGFTRINHFCRILKNHQKKGKMTKAEWEDTIKEAQKQVKKDSSDFYEMLLKVSGSGPASYYGMMKSIVSTVHSTVHSTVEYLVKSVADFVKKVSKKFNKIMTTFTQNKNWIQLKENFRELVPIIAKMTTCLFNLAKKFIADPIVYTLKSGLKWTEDIIAGNAPIKMVAFVTYPALALLYDPLTGKRRDVMKNVQNTAKYALNAISPPYTGDDLKKCGEDEINEQIFDHVLYSPGEKNVGNSFPTLLDWEEPPFKIGDIVKKVLEYRQLVHFPSTDFEVIAMSESGRMITVKPTNGQLTYKDMDGIEVEEKKFPVKYFKKK